MIWGFWAQEMTAYQKALRVFVLHDPLFSLCFEIRFGLVDWDVLSGGGLRLGPHRLRLVDVLAEFLLRKVGLDSCSR